MTDVSRRNLLKGVGLTSALPFLPGCSAVSMFNALAPKEKTSKRIARDVAYGEGPRRKRQRRGSLILLVTAKALALPNARGPVELRICHE